MSVFELEGGKIRAYREYFDEGVALLQLGFKPDSLAKVLARRIDLTRPRDGAGLARPTQHPSRESDS